MIEWKPDIDDEIGQFVSKARQNGGPHCHRGQWMIFCLATLAVMFAVIYGTELTEPLGFITLISIEVGIPRNATANNRCEDQASKFNWHQLHDNYLSPEQITSIKRPPKDEMNDTRDKFEVECKTYPANASGWCIEGNGKWRFVQNSTKRWTYKGMLRCLADKHILLIGDSRTRYQYMSLATALTRGAFPVNPEGAGDVKADSYGGMIREKTRWNDLNDWYRQTNAVLYTSNSHELCYCHPEFHYRENRFLRVKSSFGSIHLTFIQSFANSVFLESSFPPFLEGNLSCSVGECTEEKLRNGPSHKEYKMTVIEALNKYSNSFCPNVTHAFVTTGWLGEDIGCDVVKFSNATGVSAWVITGPRPLKNWAIPSEVPPQSCDAPVLDRVAMTRTSPEVLFYEDGTHVSSSLNEEFNQLLLDQICPVRTRQPE